MDNTLRVHGDTQKLERVIAICQSLGATAIERDYFEGHGVPRVSISFVDLNGELRTAVMRQVVREMCGQVYIEWLDYRPTK